MISRCKEIVFFNNKKLISGTDFFHSAYTYFDEKDKHKIIKLGIKRALGYMDLITTK